MHDSFEPIEPGLQRPLEYLRSVLIPAETLEAWAVQHRLFALSHRRLLVAATQRPADHDHPAPDRRFRCL